MNKLTQDMTRKMMMIKKTLLMVLMVTFGTTVSWGQDYSGTYYIANGNGYSAGSPDNFYLIPAEECYYDGDINKPHLTTYKTNRSTESVWRIEKEGDYYHIIHVGGEKEKYLTANSEYDGSSGNDVGRLRVHLESKSTPDNDNLFEIKSNSNGGFNIRHKDMNDKINKSNTTYLDPAGGNINDKKATSYRTMTTSNGTVNVGGTIGYWTDEAAARWHFEIAEPTYYVNSNGTEISVSGGGEVYYTYTTDTDDPAVLSTGAVGNESTKKLSENPISIVGDGPISIKLITTSKDGYTFKSSNIVNFVYNPEMELDETSFVYNGTAQSPQITSTNITINGVERPISDFVIGAKNNVNAGTAAVTLWDKTNNIYVEEPFTITPLTATFNWITEVEYNGAPQYPVVEVTNLIGEDVCNVNFIVEGEHTELDTYSATIESLSNSNYACPTDPTLLTKDFTVIKKSLGLDDGITPGKDISVTLNDGDPITFTVEYDGNPNSPLTEDTHYSVTGPETIDGSQVWTITGIGNYYFGTIKVMRFSMPFDETGVASGEDVHNVTPYKAVADMNITFKPSTDVTKSLNAYKVTHINLTKHTLTIKKLSYVPKDEPVLLLTDLTGAQTEVTATPIYKSPADRVDSSDNMLKISTPGQTVDFGQVYIYDQGKFIMTTAGTLPENSFYLERTPGSIVSNAPLYIVFDETTDVEEIRCKMDDGRDDKWYAIDGRRLIGKPTKKGLYIKNGHKVVIK